MESAVFKLYYVRAYMNEKGEMKWAIYLGNDLIKIFDDGISAQKEAKKLNDNRTKLKLDNSLPNKNYKPSFSLL